ncbi:MAG: cytidylyltransferase domain-containing protein, partial [Crocinitomicaceae bacterium]
DILVSTDGEEIIAVAEKCGLNVPFLRPENLSSDTATSQDVILHAIDYMEKQGKSYNTVVLLQPTSPFRTSEHIKAALALFDDETDMVVSVKVPEENPYYTMFEEGENGFLQLSKEGVFTRRQDCPNVYAYNGAIYVMSIESLKTKPIAEFDKVKKYEMSDLHSIDLDTPLDWDLAEIVLNKYLT